MLYDNENYLALIRQLNDDFNVIHVNNRAQILDDAFSFAYFGLLNYSTALNLTIYLVNETSFTPIRSLMNSIELVEHHMRRDKKTHVKLKVLTIFS